MPRPIPPWLALPLLLAATPATAQQAIPDTIVTATRIPTPQERVPASVTVITRAEIEARGHQTVAEALATVPGVRLAPLGGLGQQTSLFLRGNGAANTLVLLDGVPLNDVSAPSGGFDFGQDLLFDLDRIEVIRGPFSTLYGSAAIGGVVNLITRRATPGRAFAPYGEIAGGSNDTWRGGIGATGAVGAFDYLLSGNGLTTRGADATAPRFTANTGEREQYRGRFATARLGVTPAPDTRIEATLRWQQTNFGLDDIPADDADSNGENRRWFGQLRAETTLLDGRWTTGLRVFGAEDRRRFVNLADRASIATTDSLFRGSRAGIDWGNAIPLPGGGVFSDGALGFGLTHAVEEVRNRQELGFGFGSFGGRASNTQHLTAGFASLQYRLWQRLDLTGSVRHDAVTGIDGESTWRLGAALALPELATRARIAVGTAFRAPSLEERFGLGVSDFGGGFTFTSRGNPDLKPERSLGWEIGSDTDIAAGGNPRFATAGWTFFQSRVRGLIVNVFSPRDATFENIDRAEIHGAELGLTLRPLPRLEAGIAWTITEAMDARRDRRLARRPEQVVSLTARYAPIPSVVIAPTLLLTGRAAEDATYDDAGNFTGRGVARAGTVANLAVSWRVHEPITLFLEGRNLGNSRYEPANGFVTPGRTVLIGTRFAL